MDFLSAVSIIVVAPVKQGKNKPYRDSKGIVWVKQGADKRKVFDNAELIAMLMENGQMHPDRHVGYAYNSTNIANQIKPLVEYGFIEMTEPERPHSKNQKYRKVRKD